MTWMTDKLARYKSWQDKPSVQGKIRCNKEKREKNQFSGKKKKEKRVSIKGAG